LVILTKDADFFDKLILRGSPPKVVWVRTGNLRRAALVALLSQVWPQVLASIAVADLVEIHPGRVEAIKLALST
jgi:predicted nuclease of predicted toxin-antitoxin system